MQRTYEVMFIVRPDLSDEDIDKLISTMETNISNAGGTVKNAEKMGKRRLAYVVRKFADGFYILLTLEGTGELIKEIERRMRVTEQVIKFISVRTDVEDKRLAKVKKIRDAHVKGRGRNAEAAAPAPEAGTEPSPATA